MCDDSDLGSNFSEISELTDTSEDLEEIILEECSRKKHRHDFETIIPQYFEEFKEHFRMSKCIADQLADQYEATGYYKPQSGKFGKIAPLQQICIFLWFVGHQTASFREVADRFEITISSLHRVIRRVTNFLNTLSSEVIKWPDAQEIAEIEQYFREKGFPGVVGAIGGTHIKIDKPSTNPKSYINKERFYSIQLQVVCDHKLKIRDVFVGLPGSIPISKVYHASPLSNSIQEKCQNLYILGGTGYPLLPNLLTPFKNLGQLTRPQQNYNLKLSQNRFVIEHCFHELKQKFKQLSHIKLRKICDIEQLIKACCILHNMCINDEVELNKEDLELDLYAAAPLLESESDDDEDYENAVHFRNAVVNMLH